MGSRLARLAVVLVVLAAGGALTVPSAAGQVTPSQPETDNTVTRIQVFENGSARWSIQVRTRLETTDEVDRYRAFQDQLRANRTAALDRFQTRMTRVVASAANTTGREMAARRFALSTHIQEVPQRWGVVTYEFTWSGFAASDGEALVVGDVFQGGFFLAANDRLIIAEPAGYRVTASDPAPAATLEDAIAWDGRRDFADGRPRVRFESEPVSTTSTASEPASTTARSITHTAIPGAHGLPTGVLGILAALGLVVFAGLALAARRRGWWGGPSQPSGAGTAVTDADRVRALLEARGGQLKQTEIDDAVDWSSSKTSRVLSRMADDGAVEKLRIGRENVIRLPEDEAADE